MHESSLPRHLAERLRLPLLAAPMLGISGPELVAAACTAGVIGSFPTVNARSCDELAQWITQIKQESVGNSAPYAANLIMRSPRVADDVKVLVDHHTELVITSVGSPKSVLEELHSVGAKVFSDVSTLRHAQLAAQAGADGLVLLTAGAGGHTGSMNPFAFVRAVRSFFDGPVVLSGGLSDGQSLAAAQVLGCDLGMMGTAFLATAESRAVTDYKHLVARSTLDDVVLTRAFTGLPTSMLEPSIQRVGLDPKTLDETITPEGANRIYGSRGTGPKRWSEVWSAGHSVSGVQEVTTVDRLVERLVQEYGAARGGDLSFTNTLKRQYTDGK